MKARSQARVWVGEGRSDRDNGATTSSAGDDEQWRSQIQAKGKIDLGILGFSMGRV